MSQRFNPVHQVKDFSVVFLLGAPWALALAFLQRSIVELRKTPPNRVWKGDVLHVKPLRRTVFGRLLRSTGQVSGLGDAPYFGSAHLIK